MFDSCLALKISMLQCDDDNGDFKLVVWML